MGGNVVEPSAASSYSYFNFFSWSLSSDEDDLLLLLFSFFSSLLSLLLIEACELLWLLLPSSLCCLVCIRPWRWELLLLLFISAISRSLLDDDFLSFYSLKLSLFESSAATELMVFLLITRKAF